MEQNGHWLPIERSGLELVTTKGIRAILGKVRLGVVLKNMDINHISLRGYDTLNQDSDFSMVSSR